MSSPPMIRQAQPQDRDGLWSAAAVVGEEAAGFRIKDVQHTRMPKGPLIVGHAQPG